MNDIQPPASPQLAPLQAAQAHPATPAKAEQAMTAAQRQRAYRQRSKRAVTQAIGEETRASVACHDFEFREFPLVPQGAEQVPEIASRQVVSD